MHRSALLPALALALLAAPRAGAWPTHPRAYAAGLEGDHERTAVVLRFAGEPKVTVATDERTRAVLVDFSPARMADAKLFPPGELVEAAGVEPLGPDALRLVVRVRSGARVTVLRSEPGAPGFTCAVVVTDELGDVGPAGHALTWPVKGRVSSRFGMRMHPILHEHRFHKGVDIAVPHGTPIRAMRAGVVAWAGWKGGAGLCVVVRHANGLESEYKHCSKLRVASGEHVKRHQILAEAGSTGMSTGSHLHFTVTQHGKQVDPARLMRKRK